MMTVQWNRILNAGLCSVLIFQLIGCGTLLYPERRGQKAGHIDVGVALLDGIGLLFFLIPGIIAYAVDFSNGTIYLPGTAPVVVIKETKFDPKHTTKADLERIIREQTGQDVKLDDPRLQVTRLRSAEEMKARLAQAASEIEDSRLSLLE